VVKRRIACYDRSIEVGYNIYQHARVLPTENTLGAALLFPAFWFGQRFEKN
jgi:hypothetical protein